MSQATDLIQDFDDGEITTDDEVIKETTDEEVEENNENDTDSEEAEDTNTDETDNKGKAGKDNDDGYFALDEEEDNEEQPTAPVVPIPSNFSEEDKYIVDNLPLISVRVIMPDDSIKTLQVRSATELPRDMKGIATPYEDKQFDLANAAQESRARELQTNYRQHQTRIQSQEYEKRENAAIREDIDELQRNGDIPTFKAKPGTKAFDDDPAAKIVQETIDFMNTRNAKYLEKSTTGGTYRHIGFAEAYELINGNGKAKIDPKDSSARKDAARKLVSKQGGTGTKIKAPVSGRTIQQVAAEFDDFESN